MSILGKKVVGLTDLLVTAASGLAYASGPYLASEAGTIDSVSVYLTNSGGQIKMGAWLHDENHPTFPRPTTLVAATNATDVNAVGWQTGLRTSGSGVIQQGKFYWLGFISSVDRTYKLNLSESKQIWALNGPFGTGLRDPFQTGGGATQLREVSAYFTYTPTAPDSGDTSLQARINRATPGSTVRIPYGIYNERLIINKSIKLVAGRDRKGRLPIIQGGTLLTGWTLSTAPEHEDKNVWYKTGITAKFIRALQIDGQGVQVIQANPFLGGSSGYSSSQATDIRNHLLENAWNETGYALPGEAFATIAFWDWYDAIAAHTLDGTLYLRLKDGADPNDSEIYITVTQDKTTDRHVSDTLAAVVTCESQENVTIRGIEVRGGAEGILIRNSSNVVIERCKVNTPGLRNINIVDCDEVTIQKDELTGNWMQSNIGFGFGGVNTRSKAGQFGWQLSKRASITGDPSPNAHCIDLSGVTSNVVIKRNWMHHQGGGIGWGFGYDTCKVDAMIENNKFESLYSNGIAVFPRADGTVRNNKFYEVHLNFRIQDMGVAPLSGHLVVIINNYIYAIEEAAYTLQAHYASGTTWRMPIQFTDNFVRNVPGLIANLLGIANVTMDGNVLDNNSSFPTGLATYGMTAFTNNWVGGNAETVKNAAWFNANNDYTLNQRLPLEALPAPPLPILPSGYEEVGPYRQNVGVPILRSDKTYGGLFSD